MSPVPTPARGGAAGCRGASTWPCSATFPGQKQGAGLKEEQLEHEQHSHGMPGAQAADYPDTPATSLYLSFKSLKLGYATFSIQTACVFCILFTFSRSVLNSLRDSFPTVTLGAVNSRAVEIFTFINS